MNRAVVGVGSNIDPDRNVPAARALLASSHRLLAESAFVRTAPIGFPDQPDFLNGAFLVETALDRTAFEHDLHRVEQELNRVRTANRNGPRTIDLDLTAWNGAIVDPDYHTRAFLRAAVDELLGTGADSGSVHPRDANNR